MNNKYIIDTDLRLSENFTLGEFLSSQTAVRHGIANLPQPCHVSNLRNLCREVLQPLRDHIGQPIRISSGYRCPELNALVHGVGDSQHLHGCAADLHLPSEQTGKAWYFWICNHLDFDQLLFETNRYRAVWLHVSCRPDFKQNRHMAIPNYHCMY
ncbi:MAG: peptidase M15 [Prevotella sp.]|nr:peptidase M15 [Prevotella sp.]